mmetsp:Transcript_46173/g.83149  ORF Transcript_46173/g.83149 Transcript_46173/m.83149 type:complete len:447 (+) Transcript_46173:18-1358(+)
MMQNTANLPSLADHMIGRISPEDAAQFSASCRAVAEAASTFQEALAFAFTRPEALKSETHLGPEEVIMEPSPCIAMQSWKFVWQSCLQSVLASGLEPHVWAYSEHIFSVLDDPGYPPLICKLMSGFKFHSSLLKLAQPGDMVPVKLRQKTSQTVTAEISAILMIDATDNTMYEAGINVSDGLALTFLSDGQFALFIWQFTFDGSAKEGTATVYIEKSIPSVFELVSMTTGRDCQWKLAENHDGSKRLTLTASCQGEMRIRSDGPDQFPEPNLWHRGKRPVNESCGHLDKLISTLKRSQKHMVLSQPSNLSAKPILVPVIQPIVHNEPPASRDPQVAQLQADMQWAEDVQNQIRAEAASKKGSQTVHLTDGELCSTGPSHDEARVQIDIFLLTYKSHPKEFLDALVEGVPLRACRVALAQAHRHCVSQTLTQRYSLNQSIGIPSCQN